MRAKLTNEWETDGVHILDKVNTSFRVEEVPKVVRGIQKALLEEEKTVIINNSLKIVDTRMSSCNGCRKEESGILMHFYETPRPSGSITGFYICEECAEELVQALREVMERNPDVFLPYAI